MSRLRTFLQIDGVPVPTPSIYDVSIEDLSTEASGRTLDGVMHKDVVAVKDYYDCTWKHISWEAAAAILNLVDGKTQVQLTYIDPRYPNEILTNRFYVGKRSAKAVDINQPGNQWTDISLQFIRI